MNIEQITFVAAIMGFEATLLWQLFKMKKGFDVLMTFSGYGGKPNWIEQLDDKIEKVIDLLEH